MSQAESNRINYLQQSVNIFSDNQKYLQVLIEYGIFFQTN
jgi:hypothetical protein